MDAPLLSDGKPAAVTITLAYISQYPDPISMEAGERVEVGPEDPDFPGWFRCRSAVGKEGWVHREFLSGLSGPSVCREAYSARELTVHPGMTGKLLRLLDGWALVRLDDPNEDPEPVGWLPLTHLELRESSGRSLLSL